MPWPKPDGYAPARFELLARYLPAFEAQLRTFLREEFGHAWFARREAGSLLRELWNEGQRLDADEMLREVTGAELELGAIGERIREPLSA